VSRVAAAIRQAAAALRDFARGFLGLAVQASDDPDVARRPRCC